jgi:hypothetical protein
MRSRGGTMPKKEDVIRFQYVGNQPIQALKGSDFHIFGFRFIWDGENAIGEMPATEEKTIEAQIKAGRPFKILKEDKKPEPKPSAKKEKAEGEK